MIFASSQPAEGEVLEQFQCSLPPEVDEGGLEHLLQPPEDESCNDPEVPKDALAVALTYFFPVRSCSGLICCCLK